MNPTKIEYLDFTWNPTTGCSPVSPGCANCWAERMSKRLKGRYGYPADKPFRPTFHQNRLGEPTRNRKPSRIGVSFMSDIFHPEFSNGVLYDIFSRMGNTKIHTYFILTKRPQRMKEFIEWWLKNAYWSAETGKPIPIPFPNHIWLGVTVCNQAEAVEKIPILLSIPAAKRWISVEPMLGPIDLEKIPPANMGQWCGFDDDKGYVYSKGINFIALGGESGHGARPLHPDWVRSIRDQCQAAGVPFMFKQNGEFIHESQADFSSSPFHALSSRNATYHVWEDGTRSYKVGKKKAGRLLDGKEYMEMPG